ncbi:MAG TPA: hypothetical protein VIJ48_08860, partial [Acidimicrobiia bacterium]
MALRNRLFRTSLLRTGAATAGVTCVVVLALVLAACSGSKSKVQPSAATKPLVLSVRTATLKVGTVDIESAGASSIPIDTATGKAVLAAAQKYIDAAVFAPLGKGQGVAQDYSALFDPGVKATATGADEAALTDADVGKVASFSAKATPVELSALEGGFGELEYLATNFDLTVKATAPTGPLTLTHHIELTFAQTGKSWLITAYRVQSVRKSASSTTTTTAKGGTTP